MARNVRPYLGVTRLIRAVDTTLDGQIDAKRPPEAGPSKPQVPRLDPGQQAVATDELLVHAGLWLTTSSLICNWNLRFT